MPSSEAQAHHRFGFRAIVGAVVVLTASAFAFAEAQSTLHDYRLHQPGFGHQPQDGVLRPPDNTGEGSCGPTAVANSLRYLEWRYEDDYDHTLTGTDDAALRKAAEALAVTMETMSDSGTSVPNLIRGKRTYVEDRVPGVTEYGATTSIGYEEVDDLLWVNEGDPDMQFLIEWLSRGAPIEIYIDPVGSAIPAHFLTVTGVVWKDANSNGVMDGDESAELYVIDPRYPQGDGSPLIVRKHPVSDQLVVTYGSSSRGISAAIAQLPPPAGWMLFPLTMVALKRRR